MSFNLIEALIFFMVAFMALFAGAFFIFSVCFLIKWIRAFARKESKPYRIRIGIALLVISLINLIFVCTELLPKMGWPFGF